MWKDPIVEEMREAGAKLAKKCDYDIDKFSKMIKEHQKKNKARLVSKKDLKGKNKTFKHTA